MAKEDRWDLVIEPKKRLLDLELRQVWNYRDLLLLLVRRDFIANFKQTILGPLWFFIQPLLTSITYLIIFTRVAKLSTDGVPPILFYLGGVTLWNYFSGCLISSAATFNQNKNLFSKVYFPRIIMPLQVMLSHLLKFGVQFLLFLGVLIYFVNTTNAVQIQVKLLPFVLVQILSMALLGIGSGMIVSTLTTKYKDLTFLIAFGVQLVMYATPVIYPISQLPEEYREMVLLLNPCAGIIEGFKYVFTGAGSMDLALLLKNFLACCLVFFAGIIVFKRVEKSFVDVV